MTKGDVQNDLERLGIFKEMTYHTLKDPYRSPDYTRPTRSAYNGKQMSGEGPKKKSALGDGYFGDFVRIYNGDSKRDLASIMRRQRQKSAEQFIGKRWIPATPSHKITSLGSFSDTFSGPIAYFRPSIIKSNEKLRHEKNFYTSPGKKGSGSYIDVTIGKYPHHKSDPYDKRAHSVPRQKSKKFVLNTHPVDYFDPNPFRPVRLRRSQSAGTSAGGKVSQKVFKPSSPGKTIGGCKDGCFTPFPNYTSERIKILQRPKTTNLIFKLSSGPKPYPIASVIQTNINRHVNSANYRTVNNVVYT